MRRLIAQWWALILGLAIGLAGGLVYTWVINPVELVNTDPALLRVDFRREWVRLAALSYVATGNMDRSMARFKAVDSETVEHALSALIEEYAAAGRQAETLRSLTALAQALDVQTPAMLVYLGTIPPTARPATMTPTSTPTSTPSPTSTPPPSPTSTRRPTLTPTRLTPTPISTPTLHAESPLNTPTPQPTVTPPPPTPTPPLVARLQLTKREQICQPDQDLRIEVVVQDEREQGVAGMVIWLMWANGADRAVTGLKPDLGAGYVDFSAERGIGYSVGVGELGNPLVANLQIERCPAESGRGMVYGSWRLTFAPPDPDD
jgi:hypothetical protein